MKQSSLFVLLLALAASACKKNDPEAGLPKATQEGRNTAGCLVNGERFVAAESGGSLLNNPTPALSGGFAFDSVYYVSLNGGTRAGAPPSCSFCAPAWPAPTHSTAPPSTIRKEVLELS